MSKPPHMFESKKNLQQQHIVSNMFSNGSFQIFCKQSLQIRQKVPGLFIFFEALRLFIVKTI